MACGMLACDAGPLEAQVVQNAERIAFHIDEETGWVEAHVQVFYEGPPDQFAWVVPVSSQPEIFVSTDVLFDQLSTTLAPQVRLEFSTEGNCRGGRGGGIGCASEFSMARAPDPNMVDTDADDSGVDVVDAGQVGPYDYVVLQASDSAELVTWLEDNAFAISPDLDGALRPYLAEDAHFIAVRLSKGADAGDIAPLGWRYRGDTAAVPIQLTALATAPGLGLEVSVFGDARAVPESYLHVAINSAKLDYWTGGSNYYDLIGAAADQAGGHAFATDYAGDTDGLVGSLWSPERERLVEGLPASPTAAQLIDVLEGGNIPLDANGIYALRQHCEIGEPEFWWTWSSVAGACFGGPMDLEAFRADLEALVFEPMRRAEALFDSPWVTRMSSSLDADEMTVDPTFVLNPDMARVSNLYEAELITECNGKQAMDSPRRLELADGRVYRLPPSGEMRTTDFEYIDSLAGDVLAIRIEQTGKSGLAEVLADETEAAWAEVDNGRRACGCMGRQAPFAGGLLAMLTALLVRRRRLL